MAKGIRIHFDTDELSNELIQVNSNFYTKRTSNVCGSLRFPIPEPIKTELDLKAGDICYFCQYSEGFYLSFNKKPEATPESLMKQRKLASAGQYNTLYVCIPPFVKKLHPKEITNVQLMRPKGFPIQEWQVKFLSTDFT